MLFCKWADVLWVLHSLLLPSNGWWLDHGQWSLYLFFCCCGNDQTMALYQTKSVCVISKLKCFRYSWTWFVITIFELWCNFQMLWTWCNCEWWPLNLLRSWLYVRMWIEILQDFIDYRDYMGLSLMVWLCKWSLLCLISYNLDGSVTSFTYEYHRMRLKSFLRIWCIRHKPCNIFLEYGALGTNRAPILHQN